MYKHIKLTIDKFRAPYLIRHEVHRASCVVRRASIVVEIYEKISHFWDFMWVCSNVFVVDAVYHYNSRNIQAQLGTPGLMRLEHGPKIKSVYN